MKRFLIAAILGLAMGAAMIGSVPMGCGGSTTGTGGSGGGSGGTSSGEGSISTSPTTTTPVSVGGTSRYDIGSPTLTDLYLSP